MLQFVGIQILGKVELTIEQNEQKLTKVSQRNGLQGRKLAARATNSYIFRIQTCY